MLDLFFYKVCSLKKILNVQKKLIKFKETFQQWKIWTTKKNIKPLHACLNFVSQNKSIDKFVIGFNNVNELKDILKARKTKVNFNNFNIKTPENLIDPRTW